jgi:hypothetical protein
MHRLNEKAAAHSNENINSTREANMPKTAKNIKVRDQKAKEDPKGGRRHRHHPTKAPAFSNVRDPEGRPDRPVRPGGVIP